MGFVQNMRGLFRKKKSSKSKSKKRASRGSNRMNAKNMKYASTRTKRGSNKKTSSSRKISLSSRKKRSSNKIRPITRSPTEIYTYRNIINVMNDTKKYKDINIRNYHGMGEKVEATMSNLQKTAEELYNYIQELKNNDRIRSNDENLPGFKLQYIILKKNYDKAKTDANNYTM